MSRVLITGATGFVGRHTLHSLLEGGHEVHAVSRRAKASDGAIWHDVDLLSDQQVVEEVRPEVLVHLAWFAEPAAFWTSTENVRWVEASLALLRSFAAAGGRRAVLAGSCAEYDWSQAVYSEQAPQAPATLYGATKQALHITASAYADQAGFSLAWGRLFFLYGPHEAPSRFVAGLTRQLLGGAVAQMTAGTQVRDFLHSADAGAAMAALADSSVTGPVNVASGVGVSLRDLARMIAAEVGRPELLEIGALAMRPGEPESLVADTQRLRAEVGFAPRVELRAGVAATVDWWRQQLA